MAVESISRPIVIAHRGASGYLPEHTLAAYALAIEQGCDFVEPDLVMTQDGVLVCRHENELGATTDVADHPEFADRLINKFIDGRMTSGWFSEDFTLAELKSLRARERIPDVRPANDRFSGMFEVPTFAEVVCLVRGANHRFELEAREKGQEQPRVIGLYPEAKHPGYHRALGLAMEEPLLEVLRGYDLDGPESPVFVQCFETRTLKGLRAQSGVRLIQLLDIDGQPWDFTVAGDRRTFRQLLTPTELTAIADYADGIGVHKALIFPRGDDDPLADATSLVANAHGCGLLVHAWTFRAENRFLPLSMRLPPWRNDDPRAHPHAIGNLEGEVRAFLALGLDGFFTDHPDVGGRTRDAFLMSFRVTP